MKVEDMPQAEQELVRIHERRTAAETNFREGVYYGFLQAYLAVSHGASLGDLEKLFDKATEKKWSGEWGIHRTTNWEGSQRMKTRGPIMSGSA